jgi:Flp pilus assembly protein TadG
MKNSLPSSIRLRARRSAAFVRDCRGLAATEFALIVPLMLVLFLGTIDVSSGVAVDRKVTFMARTLSDLTSRATSVDDNDLNNFFAASTAIMTPYSAVPVQRTISELWIDPSTSNARVQWSKGSAPRGPGTTVAISSNLIATDSTGKAVPNQYLIFSEVSYLYVPLIGYVMDKSGVNLKDVAYTRPRQSTCVVYPTPTSGSTPACPTL